MLIPRITLAHHSLRGGCTLPRAVLLLPTTKEQFPTQPSSNFSVCVLPLSTSWVNYSWSFLLNMIDSSSLRELAIYNISMALWSRPVRGWTLQCNSFKQFTKIQCLKQFPMTNLQWDEWSELTSYTKICLTTYKVYQNFFILIIYCLYRVNNGA